ncbi:N-acyl-D-amino-acid deacylase [Haloactinopolyspora alba]|uniref:N-acyl-D-amino-acid deacylase n=1 Tax=Haloactinopolyspora alba TaxID=648780 RepID=A0A2P8E5P4_9ACTN|nr:amidohydrolase family protein [Haloactinopolyspora alba]PSL04790.1 N-acyl-D-amino-acid deacylase [Haloactinopolyspora alba]
MSAHELVLRGGVLVDGTGAGSVPADVAVDGGRVTDVVPHRRGTDRPEGHRVIDTDGCVIAPGFIDLHSHADFSLQGWPAATSQLPQGVTTLLGGNCGWSPFPVADLAELRASTAFFDPELSWEWTDGGGFAAAVDAVRPAVNLALQAGHSSLRLAAMGGDERPAAGDDIARMDALLAAAAGDGAHGFSTGLIYAPGAYADAAEVRALVAAAARHGLLYSTHIRNESDRLTAAVTEAVDAAEAAGARVQISHLKAMGRAHHGTVSAALELIDDAAARGVDIAADVYPYTASSTTLTARLPGWAMDGGPTGLLRRLADPPERDRLAAELRARIRLDADDVVIAELGEGPYRDAVGSSIGDVARRDGVDAAETTLRVLEAHDAAVAVVNHGMSEDDVATVLRHPRVAVASDGWVLRPSGSGRPHPRSFGTFPRVLGRYVREQGVLTLPEAVRKMTSLPASRLGLHDRGVVTPGAVADVVVFDPDTVADRATFKDPWRLAEGVRTVLVTGEVALDDGEITDVRAGRVLRA